MNPYAPPAAHPAEPAICPRCARPSHSLKRYALPSILFLLVFFVWRRATYTACARCMRVLIAERALVNLLTANVLWPIVVLPWIATQFARSFTVGHSSGTEGANAARPVRRSPGAAAMPARDEYDDKLDAELRQLDEPRAR